MKNQNQWRFLQWKVRFGLGQITGLPVRFGSEPQCSDEDEDEDEDEDSLLTSGEPSRMINELFLARFAVLKKVVTDGPTDQWMDQRTDKASYVDASKNIALLVI